MKSASPKPAWGSGEEEGPRRWWVSKIFFAWLVPTVVKGYRAPLTESDTPALPAAFRSRRMAERAAEIWRQELAKKSPRLWRVIFRLNGPEIAIGVVTNILQGVFNVVLRPLMLKLLIQRVSSGEKDVGKEVTLLALFSAVIIAEALSSSLSRVVLADDLGTKFVAGIGGLVQRKATSMSSATKVAQDESVLLGNDVIRTFENLKFMSQTPSFISGMIGGCTLLFALTGVSGLAGFFVMFTLLSFNMRLSKSNKVLEAKNLEAADCRVKMMKQILDGIKAIKFMAWEESYIRVVCEARWMEMKFIRKFRLFMACSNNIGRANPIISACACFVFVGLLQGENLTADNVFATLTVFQSLRMPLILMPMSLTMSAQLRVSLKRLEGYLLAEEGPARQVLPEGSMNAAVIKDASFRWPGAESDALAGVDLELTKGSLTAVVGAVGSGKSTLLTGLIGEMQCSGSVQTLQSVAYIPQKAFVLSGTLRDNVLMGRPYDEASYRDALASSMLQTDLELMVDGDATEIGERGVTLSGGQQQRLAVARALYCRSDLLVADDSLAAVDGRVGNAIFEKAFKARAHDGGATVVLALNQVHLLEQFDQIVYLVEGRIAGMGTYKDLMNQVPSFQSFVRTGPSGGDLDDAEAPASAEAGGAKPSSAKEGGDDVGKAPTDGKAVDALKAKDSTKSALVKKEKTNKGAVQWMVIKTYIRAMGLCRFTWGILICAAAYATMAATDQWLAYWLSEVRSATTAGEKVDMGFYVGVYAGLVLSYVALILTGTYLFNEGSTRAGKQLHGECLSRIMHAPVSWFETTPSGRIISRFSADLSLVDVRLSDMTDVIVQFFFNILVLVIVVCVIVPHVTPALLAGGALFYLQYTAVDRSTREVKRFANNAMSPILTNMMEIGRARTLIRTMGYEEFFHARHCNFMDDFGRHNYFASELFHGGMLCGSTISFFITTLAAAVILLMSDSFEPTMAALALTYSYLMPYFLMVFSAILGMTKLCLASLERLLEYRGAEVVQEQEWEQPGDKSEALAAWPSQGAVTFKSVTLVYREGLKPAIQEVSFEIGGGERVSIIGRTGAGKSSLMVLLFRICEASSGEILIDGQNIASIGLQTLRKRLSIVPQEPLLMEGTVRTNLDPFGAHQEAELVEVLEASGLGAKILDVEVGSGGRSISAGESQLVSFARTLLRRTRVVVMDEPTSNIDAATDEKVQQIVRSAFAGATLMTIAHRLETVIDGDRMLVMDAGRLVENGRPSDLAADPSSQLSSMLRSMGPQLERKLREKATASSQSARLEGQAEQAEVIEVEDDRDVMSL